MKVPIVKEHGSWVVFVLSCVAGVTTGLLTHPWQAGREFSVETFLTILGLALLINSKSPLSSVLRAGGQRREPLLWFLGFSLAGMALLTPFLTEGLGSFWVFSPLVLSYVVLLSAGKEHALIAELNGFALLSLAAPIVHFVITGEMSFTLYLAVFLFFGAGVFKVRVRVRKTTGYRVLMPLYCLSALAVFLYVGISTIMLLPLLENIAFSIWPREEKLRTTGNIELIKGVIFTALLGFFWKG